MAIDIPTVMNSLFPAGTLLLALLLIFAAILHINNLNRVHKLMAVLQHKKEVSKAIFYKEMTVSQGSNFTALALAAWIMLFVAVAYLYLLVPTILPFSYMDIAELASSTLGFAIFGILVACLAGAIILFLDKLPQDHRDLKLMELYSFYSISKTMKKTDRHDGYCLMHLCTAISLYRHNLSDSFAACRAFEPDAFGCIGRRTCHADL